MEPWYGATEDCSLGWIQVRVDHGKLGPEMSAL